MENPKPVNLQTDAEVKALGWPVWARDKDGHLVTMCARDRADDKFFGEFLVECFDQGLTVIDARKVVG